MKLQHLILGILVILSLNTYGQSNAIRSQIVDQFNTPIIAAWVSIDNNPGKVQTNEDGFFDLITEKWPVHIHVDLGDGAPMHIEINSPEEALVIKTNKETTLDEVVVKDNHSRELSTLKTRNVETLNEREFQKAACCRLSESFDATGSVSVSETDAVTGAKEMEVLGLRGIYSLMTLDNTPDFMGIVFPFALDMIPGTWLKEVAISKGISNAINGSGGIAGQVNIGTKEPFTDDPLFVNLYGSTLGRYEANVHLNRVLKNPAFATGLYLHGSKNFNELDHNGDGFLDMPLSQQLNGMWKLRMRGAGPWEGGVNVQLVQDVRTSGQIAPVGENSYVSEVDARRFTVNGNTGYAGFNKEGRSIGFKYQYTNNQLDAAFGRLDYLGSQHRGYVQALYEDRFKEGDHIIYAGMSMQMEKLDQTIAQQDFSRREHTPGIYAEYAFNPEIKNDDKRFMRRLGVIATLRADFNNLFGTQIAPTLALKYNFTEDQLIRANIGKGYRTPYFFTDNISTFTNGRPFELLNMDTPKAEEAINYGVSYTLKTNLAGNAFSMNADLYQTRFQNQIIVDAESDHNRVLVYNLDGISETTSALINANYELMEGFNLKMAYKWNHIIFDQLSGRVNKAMVPKHRGLVALHYTTPNKEWEFSNSTHIIGSQEFMQRVSHNGDVHMERRNADPFVNVNVQATKKWNSFDLYIGGENLANVRQNVPVQGFDNPLGETFDVTQVYSPVVGIRGYAGIRWTLF